MGTEQYANEALEEMAREFYEDTGILAPFKDSREWRDDVEVNKLWKVWCKGRLRGIEITEKAVVKP